MPDPVAPFDTRAFRNACGKFATGITVVTTVIDGETHGMTANAFMSVSLEPPLVAVSVAKKAHMHNHIAQSGRYAVSILRADQESHSSHFAGWAVDGFEVEFDERHGHPIIGEAIATFVTTVVDAHEAGDHTIYIGQVDYFESTEEDPVLFYAGKYRQISPTS